jgi:hypothetical protein
MFNKNLVSETFASYSPSMPNRPWLPLKKRTDSKKGPLFGRFGRKTRGCAQEKSILFCTFSRFGVFFFCMLLSGKRLQIPQGSQKNRA